MICWSADTRGKLCGGTLTWSRTERGWSGHCAKCDVQRRAASREELELDRQAEVQP